MNPTTGTWLTPPQLLPLESGEVHVWRAYLDGTHPTLPELWTWLSADERERAERFHFRQDRDRYVAARGVLRDILSRYLKTPPDQIRFSYGKHGKPALSGETDAARITFNLSHSRDIALYAIAKSRAVGIDIEFVRDDYAGAEIARRFFSPEECSALDALPHGLRTTAFFNCWTRKESYIKARGEGLSIPLNSFSVSCIPGEPARLLRTDDAERGVAHWSLLNIQPGHGHVAALAADGSLSRICFWQWQRACEQLAAAREQALAGSGDGRRSE